MATAVVPSGRASPHDNDVERIMAQYDTDKSGTFSAPEVKAIVRDLMASKAQSRQMIRFIFGLVIAVLLMAGAIVGLVIASNEITKENHTTEGTLVSKDKGEAVQVASVQSYASLLDLVVLSTTTLSKLERVTFDYQDVAANGQTAPRRSEGSFEIEGFSRPLDPETDEVSKTQLVLLTKTGYRVLIDTLGGPDKLGAATLIMDGLAYDVDVEQSSATASVRRRAHRGESNEVADELEVLLSQESFIRRDAQRLEATAVSPRRRKGRGGGGFKGGKISGGGSLKVSVKSPVYYPVIMPRPYIYGRGYYYNGVYNQYDCEGNCSSSSRLGPSAVDSFLFVPLLLAMPLFAWGTAA